MGKNELKFSEKNGGLVFVKFFSVPAKKVWEAITDPEKMKEWYFNVPMFRAVIGNEFHFMGGPPDGTQYKHLCKVTEVITEKKLSYTWKYDGYQGESTVVFELTPENGGTRLTLTHKGLDTFPSNIPDFDSSNFKAGWTEIIGTNLGHYLEKNRS
jgi:uncharacterized protein YndB with AHSA1/START domain